MACAGFVSMFTTEAEPATRLSAANSVHDFDQNKQGQRNREEHEDAESGEEQPVISSLAGMPRQMRLEQAEISAIGLEDHVEEGAEERNGSGERFDADVDEHAGDGDSGDSKLNRAADDVKGDEGVEDVSQARD